MIELNQKVPDFTFVTLEGEHRLADFKGKTVVLYFYPRDNTPGCSQQAQDFRDQLKQFNKANTVVLGISRDSLKSHDKFKQKFDLNFALISDESEDICNLFDVIKQKNMYGKKVRGIERSTFLIDSSGKLIQEWRKVKVPGHVAEVLSAVTALQD